MTRSRRGKQPGAIPTTYAGRTYRSRLEARVAQLLAAIGMRVRYEPECFLLAGGECYLPDWREEGTDNYVEARGYCSARGRAQIEEFVDLLPLDATYVVIREEKAGGSKCWSEGKWSEAYLHLERPGYRLPIRCVDSRVQLRLYGQWLTLPDLRTALEREGGTLIGARLGGE